MTTTLYETVTGKTLAVDYDAQTDRDINGQSLDANSEDAKDLGAVLLFTPEYLSMQLHKTILGTRDMVADLVSKPTKWVKGVYRLPGQFSAVAHFAPKAEKNRKIATN